MCTTTLPQLPFSLPRRFTIINHSASLFCHKPNNINRRRNGFQPLNPKPRLKCSINEAQHSQIQEDTNGFWSKWKGKSGEMSSKLAKLGLAAVLAYGIFDGVTYTSFFVLAFLGYEKSTGNNPAANLQALLGIVILMWTGNNITRPFRVAGAAALAPVMDKGLRKIQKYFNFPRLVYAFALVVSIIAGSCLTVVGLLILSRWGK